MNLKFYLKDKKKLGNVVGVYPLNLNISILLNKKPFFKFENSTILLNKTELVSLADLPIAFLTFLPAHSNPSSTENATYKSNWSSQDVK